MSNTSFREASWIFFEKKRLNVHQRYVPQLPIVAPVGRVLARSEKASIGHRDDYLQTTIGWATISRATPNVAVSSTDGAQLHQCL